MTFTGWMSLSESGSEWLQQFTSVFMAWRHRTWLNSVCRLSRQRVVMVDFGPPPPAIWSFHGADWRPTALELLVSLAQSVGTLCLII